MAELLENYVRVLRPDHPDTLAVRNDVSHWQDSSLTEVELTFADYRHPSRGRSLSKTLTRGAERLVFR